MSRTMKWLAGVGGVLIGGLLLSLLVNRMLAPRDAVRADVAALGERVAGYRTALEDERRVRDAMDALTDRTLGGDVEVVDHHLRTRLNRLAERAGLAGAAVGTGGPAARRSPARTAFPRGGIWRELRDAIDFVEIEGWLTAEGTLAQAVELVDAVAAEPWIKRVQQVKLDPKDNGDRVTLTLRLTTVFVPGRGPAEIPSVAAYDRGRLDRFARLLDRNPFAVPAPPPAPVETVAQEVPTPPPPPAAPSFPWEDWQLTGVAEGPSGREAWLRNRATGAARRLAVGEQIDRAVLASASGEWAEFALGEQRFRVQVGRNLNDRERLRE
ncbi:MAG: hypothetical protein KJO43_03295 [Phycisphaerae bacterium]|nr:hypothetical protein [Phycisphaerae bacterium]